MDKKKGFWNFMAEDLLDWCQKRSEMRERWEGYLN